MNRSEKIQAHKADEKYGKGGWEWADYAPDDYEGALVHSCNCNCADCSDLD